MATEPTTASAISTVLPRRDLEFRPIDWWADADDGAASFEPPRHKPPVPAFVRLSRLVEPDPVAAACDIESPITVETPHSPAVDTDDSELPLGREVTRRRWVDSAGRPLFRIGLLAIVAAIVVGIATFGPGGNDLATVESPDMADEVVPGVAGGVAGSGEQAHQVLESLVHQSSAGGEADLSIVGTASGDETEVRWTATIRNAGPETATGPITVIHAIGSDFELASVAGSGWDCRQLPSAGTITCELDEDMGTGQRRRLGLVTSITGIEPGTSVPSTMSVVADTADPNLEDNTINIMAETARTDDDVDGNRSRSTGAAGQAHNDTEADTTVGAGGGSGTDQSGSAGMEELPRTGSGLAAFLGFAGVGLCLAGRRLTSWSARAQTRTLLVAANLG